jgi:hypothetical protein
VVLVGTGLAGQSAVASARAPIATMAAKHHRPDAKALAMRYVRDSIFENPYLNAEETLRTWQSFNFCRGLYAYDAGHPTPQDLDIKTDQSGAWHISQATERKGQLRTASVAYTIDDYRSDDTLSGPGDPQPPSPGSYSLVAHGRNSATIDGATYTRYPQTASCGAENGPGGF